MGRTETGRGTLKEVWNVSEDSPGGPGRVGVPRGCRRQVGGPLVRTETDGRTSGSYGTGRGTLKEVRDGSGDPRGCPERFGGHSGRSGTGRGPSELPGTGRGTLGEVRDGSGCSGTVRVTLG